MLVRGVCPVNFGSTGVFLLLLWTELREWLLRFCSQSTRDFVFLQYLYSSRVTSAVNLIADLLCEYIVIILRASYCIITRLAHASMTLCQNSLSVFAGSPKYFYSNTFFVFGVISKQTNFCTHQLEYCFRPFCPFRKDYKTIGKVTVGYFWHEIWEHTQHAVVSDPLHLFFEIYRVAVTLWQVK